MTLSLRSRWLPALLLVAAASAASLAPGAFLLEREALGQGEVWRLWTGHFVHHTLEHFVFDVGIAVFLLLLVRRALAWLVLAPFVGGVVLAARPDLASYAGLSGVLHGLTVLAGVSVFREGRGFERVAAAALLVGVCAKAVYEAAANVSIFSGGFDMGAETIFVAHLAGVTGGLLLLTLEWARGGPCPDVPPSELGETDASRSLDEWFSPQACSVHVEDEVPSRGPA